MKTATVLALCAITCLLGGCELMQQGLCAPHCASRTQGSSSLVNFLYPDGTLPPAGNSVPELRVPLRVGLAFLPPQARQGASPLDAAQKENLLQQVRARFATRSFISEIVVIPDYYLANTRGFAGLEGVQRLYNVDLMALVSYDQVSHADDNKLSLGYLTIVGAFVLHGSSHETATLVDLAVVDPATRSLVLRAGGTDARGSSSALVDVGRDIRHESASGFDAATGRMIGNFDVALTAFEADVRAGKANVRVVQRQGSRGGGGAMGAAGLCILLLCVAWRRIRV